MSSIVPHIVSHVLHAHRILGHRGIAIICVASAADPSIDPPEILSFRYHLLNKIYDIYNVNLTPSNYFDKNDPGLEDNYYLDIIERAAGEMDDACMELRGLLHEVNIADLSITPRRMIESMAYATRRLPDNTTIHLGSLRAITAQPLPREVIEQISIIEQYVDDIHRARALFTETIRRPETMTEDWQSSGFRSRSHFIRQVLVPIAMTQFSGGAHFMRWLSLAWQNVIRSGRKETQGFHSRDVIYDPQKCLLLGSYAAAQPHRPIKRALWTAKLRGFWTYPEVGYSLRSFIHQQEASVASRTLGRKILQTTLDNPRKRASWLQSVEESQGGISDVTSDEVSKSFDRLIESRPKHHMRVIETGSTQDVVMDDYASRNAKLEITRITSFQSPKRHSQLICPRCSIRICLRKDMDRHLKVKHGEHRQVYYCSVQKCKRSRSQRYPFDRLDNWRRHMQTFHKIIEPIAADADMVSPDHDAAGFLQSSSCSNFAAS